MNSDNGDHLEEAAQHSAWTWSNPPGLQAAAQGGGVRWVAWTWSDCTRATGSCQEEEVHSELLGLLPITLENRVTAQRNRHAAGRWDSEVLYRAPGGCSEEG